MKTGLLKLVRFASVLCLAVWAVGPRAAAQTPLPDDFNPGANDSVYALSVQPDGKILVAGAFTTLAGQSRYRIGRLRVSDDPVLYTTPAANQSNEFRPEVLTFPTSNLVTGDNVMAVEVHQAGTTSSDDVFGMTLRGSPQETLGCRLNLVQDGSEVILDWTGGQGPYQVQQTSALGPTTTWENVGEPVQTNSMRIPIGPGNVFLRVPAAIPANSC